MEKEAKTTVVSLGFIKGGVGKTNIAILLAKYCAAAGKRVVLADSDLNNSLSFYFLNKEMMERTRKLNLAAALSDEGNDLSSFAVPTDTPGVDLIASTPYLADMRTLSEKRLKRLVPGLYGKYDILIIDCHPTYDNIVLNTFHAADYIITPVLKDLFSYNAAMFMSEVLPRDVEDLKSWYVLINGYNRRYEEARSGRQSDFIDLYRKGGFPLTPVETWLPWTAQIHLVVDYHKRLTCMKDAPGAVYNPALYHAIAELAGCFFEGALEAPGVF
ncbi:MAG: ParA family protein [Spirochaetaceae bacterium]|jgi:chromosome partitioning protein|nr:ParA family protein [Spirochaetaceae bacterium]